MEIFSVNVIPNIMKKIKKIQLKHNVKIDGSNLFKMKICESPTEATNLVVFCFGHCLFIEKKT